jgi:hypothetical protein
MRSRNVLIPAAVLVSAFSCAGQSTPPAPSNPPPTLPAAPPKALEGATITITATGFTLDAATAAVFKIDAMHLYKGSRITFVNQDIIPHDIQSDPPLTHTECPEVASAGFVVPGQSKPTAPLDRLISCGFHDHFHEGDPRFSGRAIIEDR